MTLGQICVITAGLLWVASAAVLQEVARVLGPSFHTRTTVHWGWRTLAWLGALIMLVRGITLLFPGQLVEVSRISVVAPLGAVAVLGVTLALLDWVMRDRAPPPWSVQIMRAAALLGRDGPVKFAAFAVPPAAAGATIPTDAPTGRRSRLSVLIGAGTVLAGVAIFLAMNALGGQ